MIARTIQQRVMSRTVPLPSLLARASKNSSGVTRDDMEAFAGGNIRDDLRASHP